MKKIYLIRHAQSESNAGLIIRPNSQINITDLGKKQASALADWLIENINTPKQVFVSNYIRTSQTAEPYLTKLNYQAEVIDDLYEFNYLDFEHIRDLSFQELVKVADEYWQKADIHFQDSQNTDSYAQFVQRVKKVRKFFDSLEDGCYVVFTHGMWLGMLMWQLLHDDSECVENMQKFRAFELSIRPKNCDIFLLNIDNKQSICKVKSQKMD